MNLEPRFDSTRSESAEPHDIVKVAAWLLAASITFGALYLGQIVFIPLAIAFLIGFALNPPVTWLTRRGVPRLVSVMAVMLTLAIIIGALGLLVASQIKTLGAELPTYQSTIRQKVHDLSETLRGPGFFDWAARTVDTIKAEVETNKVAAGAPPQLVEVVQPPVPPFQTTLEWIAPALEPLATAGIVIIFVFLALLDRGDLRDRLLRLLGGNLHKSTDAMEEAGKRISKYLLMQVIVNASYGIPMAIGLWWIGVPGWLLWGTLAAVLRFIPYLGPLLSSVFPLALAFAVHPGWEMVVWTLGLIIVLEVISNNIVEPLLYGTSTGLSAMSLIAAAIFWTALWGPVGLILSTPLTVCLLVIGRTNPQLNFLDTLLGSTPVLDLPTRVYQRLIANDPEDAIEIIDSAIIDGDVVAFYNDYGIEVLRKVSDDYLTNSRPEHRLRIANGMDAVLEDIIEEYAPGTAPPPQPRIACIGGRWEIDSVACDMLVHAFALAGLAAVARREGVVTSRYLNSLGLDKVEVVCLSYFSREPERSIKSFCRKIHNRWPSIKIIVVLWNAPESLLAPGRIASLGADGVVTTVREAISHVHRILSPDEARKLQVADRPDNDDIRVGALLATDVLDGHAREELDGLAKRAAAVFNVKFAVISALDKNHEYIIGQSIDLPGEKTLDGRDMITMPRKDAVCDHVVAQGETLVVTDTQRDPRFADHPAIRLWKTSFYAGAPLKTSDGLVLGALCLLDTDPRQLSDEERSLLEAMSADVVSAMTGDEVNVPAPQAGEVSESATVGQPIPG